MKAKTAFLQGMIARLEMKINLTPLEITLILLMSLTIYVWAKQGKRIMRWLKDWRRQRRGPRRLRPKEPETCPLCRQGITWLHRHPADEEPWGERKSRRGRKKRVNSDGYACLNEQCDYYGNTDGAVHALVSDGRRGEGQDIQYWRCQSCGGRQSSRLATPMYQIRTPLARVER